MGSTQTLLSELIGKPLENNSTVHELLTTAAQAQGTLIAIAALHQDSSFLSSLSGSDPTSFPYLRWTFNELLHASHRTAVALAENGIRAGQLIVAYVTCGVEFHIMVRAALELNCPFAPLNPRTTANVKETRNFFEILKPAVIMVPDVNTAANLSSSVPDGLDEASLLLVCGGGTLHGRWQDLCEFVEDTPGSLDITALKVQRRMDDTVLVLFTSGTTSLPKGAPYTNRSWATMILSSKIANELSPARIVCCTPALFHLLGVHFWVQFHAAGSKVVHPSAWFDAGACLAAIRSERITDILGVPAMMSALVGHPDFKKTDTSRLELLTLGATIVLPEHLRMCTEDLKAKKVVNSFGMTEAGCPLIGSPDQVQLGSYPTMGSMVRICDPETSEILPRGESGEFHIGGPPIIQKYWLSKDHDTIKANSSFYDDEQGHWIKTGDQAVMAENGHVSIVGRYKDLIIRGGENIAPSAIESILTESFGLIAEVVGIPDEIAGEVPVAVVKGARNTNLQEVREAIFKRLGSGFIIEEIILLSDLGRDEFPKTATGKVKKDELQRTVLEYLAKQDTAVYVSDGIGATLTNLWTKILGIGSITPQTSVRDYADSLVLARFSARLRRTTGQFLSLQQLLDHPTIEEQVKLLSNAQIIDETGFSTLFPLHDGPLELQHVSYAMGSPIKFEATKRLGDKVLRPLGLAWDDLEAVFPMQDHMQRMLKRWRPQSNNIRQTWLCRGKSTLEVEASLKQSLRHHPILRSMVIKQDNDVLHAIVRPSDKFFSHFINVTGPIIDISALNKLRYNDLEFDFAADPGPMFRIFIMNVEKEGCAGVLYLAQHSVFDGLSITLWLDDLDTMLSEPSLTLPSHVPYQAWAENLYNLRHSREAQQSIAWNFDRLSGMRTQRNALFPKPRVPGWFKGNTDGWLDLTTGKRGQHRPMLDDFDGVKGISETARLQDVIELKAKHGVEIPQILKAALAIVTAHHTSSSVAFFGQYQAGRSWPFLPDWQASRMPDAMHINGPTLQLVALRVVVEQNDTVLNMLQTLQGEQVGLNKHCHAPYFDLVAKLNEAGEDEGAMMEDILRRQMFNWLPVGPAEYKCLEETSRLSRTNLGILWNCTMPEQGIVLVQPTWDSAQLLMTEVRRLLQEVVVVAELLGNRENWGRQIGELMQLPATQTEARKD